MADVTALETLNLKTFLDEHVSMDDAYLMRGIHVDKIQDKIGEIITQINLNTTDVDTVEGYDPATISPIKSIAVTLTATEIVANAAGALAHADGSILVAAPGTGYTLEFISAVLIYDHATADYTGGGDDVVINVGVTGTQLAQSSVINKADLLTAAGDKIVFISSLDAADLALVDNSAISLFAGTAFTQPGTAAGVLRCHVSYRVHTTGLA